MFFLCPAEPIHPEKAEPASCCPQATFSAAALAEQADITGPSGWWGDGSPAARLAAQVLAWLAAHVEATTELRPAFARTALTFPSIWFVTTLADAGAAFLVFFGAGGLGCGLSLGLDMVGADFGFTAVLGCGFAATLGFAFFGAVDGFGVAETVGSGLVSALGFGVGDCDGAGLLSFSMGDALWSVGWGSALAEGAPDEFPAAALSIGEDAVPCPGSPAEQPANTSATLAPKAPSN